MKRTVKAIGLLVAVASLVLVTSPAFAVHSASFHASGSSHAAAVVRTPETRAGVLSAVNRNPSNTRVTVGNSDTSIARGVARIGLYTCQSGCWSVWAYTGSTWGLLGQCSQDILIYPTTLPGNLLICKGRAGTVIRSAPNSSAHVLGTVLANTRYRTDRLVLQVAGKSGSDGLGWYRILWKGRPAYVASYRVSNMTDGCSGWKTYWSFTNPPTGRIFRAG
jgi:hypothetical protein